MKIAHLTDLHIFSLDGARVRDFLGKRSLGGLNFWLRRRRKHHEGLFEAAVDDVNRQGYDHVVLTGDLTNLALPGEFRRARSIIDRIAGGSGRLTLLPGNHDAYTRKAVEAGVFERIFADYLPKPLGWPWVRQLGGVTLIALSTAVPTPWGFSSGRVGEDQRAKMEAALYAAQKSGAFRLLALHHPPVHARGSGMRQLSDRARLATSLGQYGCELIIHGHDHRDQHNEIAGPNGPIPVFGAPSTTYTDPRPDRRARYNVYTIEESHFVGKESRDFPRASSPEAD